MLKFIVFLRIAIIILLYKVKNLLFKRRNRKMKTENGKMKTAKKRFGFVMLAILASAVMLLAGCSDGDSGGGGSSETLVTRYSYNLTSNENYYYVREYHAYYKGNYVYSVHDYIVHFFLKTSSSYKDKTGSELCSIAANRSYTPKSKTTYVVEGDKTHTINVSQSDDSTIQVTMNIADGTPYESWVYR